jgi:hypothetical protein
MGKGAVRIAQISIFPLSSLTDSIVLPSPSPMSLSADCSGFHIFSAAQEYLPKKPPLYCIL